MKLLKKLSKFFKTIFQFRRYIRLRKTERILKQAVASQRVDKIIYKDIINKDMRKALRIDADSDYIPDDVKNRAEVKEMVLARHGDQMNFLNIKITDDLKLI